MKSWVRRTLITSFGIMSLSMAPVGVLNYNSLAALAAQNTDSTTDVGSDTTTVSPFKVQPQPKDLQHVDINTNNISLNFNDNTIAKLKTTEAVTLEYWDGNSDEGWKDTGVTLNVDGDGNISAEEVASDSLALNHELRIKTASGQVSNIFYINCNTYAEHVIPTPLSSMTTAEEYGYTAGDTIYLVPDLESQKDITEIRWQVSSDGGKSYKTFATIQPEKGDNLLLQLDANCSLTGNLYRYAVNPVGTSASYSKPIEVFVFEKYTINGSTLNITDAGSDGKMNDYLNGRLKDQCPWETNKNIIRTVHVENIEELGAGAFYGCSKLNKVELEGVTTVGQESFENCSSLAAVTLPVSVDSVEKDAFKGCTGLKEIRILDPDTKINSSANTIPLTSTDTTSPSATTSKKALVENEHSYPVIYGYKGIAKDSANNINSTTAGSTAYDYAVSNNRSFYPIGAIDSQGYERPIKWDYILDGNNITHLSISRDSIDAGALSDSNGVELHIPKTVDGYEVTELNGIDESFATPICGKENDPDHEHTVDCYKNGGARDVFGSYIYFASVNDTDQDETVTIKTLYIPDTVTLIRNGAFQTATIYSIYDFAKTAQLTEENFVAPDDEATTCTLYTYSTNYTIRRAASAFKMVLFDVDYFTGSTGDLIWTVDFDNNSLELSGSGKSGSYAKAADVPFYWARNDINRIIIGKDVTSIGDYLFADEEYVSNIKNASKILSYVSTTAFQNVSQKWDYGNKQIITYVNNGIYDAITDLNAALRVSSTADKIQALDTEIADLEQKIEETTAALEEAQAAETPSTVLIKRLTSNLESYKTKLDEDISKKESYENSTWDLFNFSFLDTTTDCGAGIEFTYTAATQTLQINGDGIMTAFNSPTDAPWRPVNTYIRKVIIGAEVTSISNFAFNNLDNLKSVFNYGKNQTLEGGSDMIFDIIDRHTSVGEAMVTAAHLSIPTIDFNTATEEEKEAWYEDIEKQAQVYYLPLTVANMKNWTLTCSKTEHTHTDTCYTDGELTCTIEEHTHTEDCYNQDGTPYNIIPGEYYIPKEYTTEQILNVLTGNEKDMVSEKYIVPVYTFGDDNEAFSNAVPPEEDGYKLMAIYNEKGQCGDDLTFYVSLDNALMIEGTGAMWDFDESSAPWIKSANSITSVYMPTGMTSIGTFAFEDFELMESFNIPTSVTSIGKGAFKDCVNLYSFEIGSQYMSIGSGIFAGCTSLRIVTSNNGDYSVNDGYLVDNPNKKILGFLRETLYKDVATKTLYTNPEEYTVPSDVKVIGELAYYEAGSFYNLIIPAGIETIEDNAFLGCSKIESIDLKSTEKVTVADTAIEGCGTVYDKDDAKKYAILYAINEDFAKIAEKEGYTIVYHDSKNIKYLTAAYAGGTVMVGQTFDPNDVQIAIVYEDGQSENIFGTDARISFKNSTVTKMGENVFTATFDDGYGQVLETNEFTVQGTNAVTSVVFSYTGPTVWYGDTIDTNYVLAKLTYADGSTKTINGNATYATASGNKNCITLGQKTITQEGDVEIPVSYKDNTTGTFNGTVAIRCQNYITNLAAEYTGGPVELAAGAAGLDLDQLKITITWSDGSTENITGEDPRVSITATPTLMGQNQVFEFTVDDRDRYGHTGSFICSYTSNIESVQFDYVGAAVTNGMVFSFSDVQLTLNYSNGSSQKVMGDTVTGLEADNMIIHTSDSTETIHLTYTVGAKAYTGTIYVPGKIRIPVKLIVVKRPTKSVYQDGDVFDPAGMVVNCLFDNGVTQDVTESVTIDAGGVLNSNTKSVTITYDDSSSGYSIKTNMSLNVNQYQKQLVLEKQFKEQYEISKVLFRSKKTEDTANADDEDEDDEDQDTGSSDDTDDEDDDMGKWQDITPLLSYSSYDDQHNAQDATGNYLYNAPEIKAGYGFELKVYTKYRTNRAGSEFSAFLKKTQWDREFENVYTSISHDEFETRWKYLNDVYPQAAPTANPDLLYFRTTNGQLVDEDGNPIKNLVSADGSMTDFLVMEKTNLTETGDKIDEGEWFNSTKIFELPLRAVIGDEETRRVYISRDAANPNQAYTDYTIQIISPAWFGYDPEPYFEGDKFHYSTDEDELYAQKSYAYKDPQTKYLHVCVGITIRVKANDDVKTHILE